MLSDKYFYMSNSQNSTHIKKESSPVKMYFLVTFPRN